MLQPQGWRALQLASGHLKDDREVVVEALPQPQGWKALRFCLGLSQDGPSGCLESSVAITGLAGTQVSLNSSER